MRKSTAPQASPKASPSSYPIGPAGEAGLSDSEILAGALGLDVGAAHSVVREAGSLYNAFRMDPRRLRSSAGIDDGCVQRLRCMSAALRRLESAAAEEEYAGDSIDSPEALAAIYGPRLRDLDREVFMVVHLNAALRPISTHVVSVGGLFASVVDPRAVFREAILSNAASIVAFHNHPSGNPEPSKQDLKITRQLDEVGKLTGMTLIDHIIIAGTKHTSLKKRGVI